MPRSSYPKPRVISADEAAAADVLEGLGISDLETSDEDGSNTSRQPAHQQVHTPSTQAQKYSKSTSLVKTPKNQAPAIKKPNTQFPVSKKGVIANISSSDQAQAPGALLGRLIATLINVSFKS